MLGTALHEVQRPGGAARPCNDGGSSIPEGKRPRRIPAAVVRKLLVRLLLKSGKPAEARTICNRSQRRVRTPRASWLLARAIMQEGDWRRAAAVLPRASSFRDEHPQEPEPAPYVGEARCTGCHRSSLIPCSPVGTPRLRPPRGIKNLPLPDGPLADPGNPQVDQHFRRADDTLVVETRAGQKVRRAVMDYAFGSPDRYRTFVGRDDRGRSFMIRMSYCRSPRGTAWDISTGLPPRPDDEEEYLGKKMAEGDGIDAV